MSSTNTINFVWSPYDFCTVITTVRNDPVVRGMCVALSVQYYYVGEQKVKHTKPTSVFLRRLVKFSFFFFFFLPKKETGFRLLFDWFVWFVWFYGISTLAGYSTPNPNPYQPLQVIQRQNHFYVNNLFYWKQFSLIVKDISISNYSSSYM